MPHDACAGLTQQDRLRQKIQMYVPRELTVPVSQRSMMQRTPCCRTFVLNGRDRLACDCPPHFACEGPCGSWDGRSPSLCDKPLALRARETEEVACVCPTAFAVVGRPIRR